MSKTPFCDTSDLYTLHIKVYATITTFQKEKYVGFSALSELSFAGGWPGQSTFHLGTIGMAMKGAPSTLVVCGGGGGGHWSQRSGNLVDFSIIIYSVGHQCPLRL